ncbi:MAG: response regulator transcription factor [Chloroflexota bacterium]
MSNPPPENRTPVATDPALGRGARIRVGIVEDHHLVREGLRMILASHGIEVAGEATGTRDAFDLIERCRPDVLLVDLSLGDGDGVALLHDIRARAPEQRVVVLTMHQGAETVRQALLAGAWGYVVKGVHSDDLIDAIRAVHNGERYLHSSVTAAVVDDSIRWLQSGSPLTLREREVIGLLATGLNATAIGRRLGISTHTVRRHLANLYAKLGVRGIPGLVHYAIREGLVREERA